jgi:HEAT repeat protein/MFS family permease
MATTLEWALEAGLRIRPGEQRRAALMAAYAANAVGAVVVGRSVRDALFLAHNATKGLAWMYVASSAAIVLTSWVYGRYADRVQRGKLNSTSALLCALGCAACWVLLQRGVGSWIYPTLYIFVEVLGSVVVMQFWTLANDVFHAREAKRLFGIIGGGGTLANVVFGLLVGRYASQWKAPNLLLLMVAQLVLCAVLARAASRTVTLAPLLVKPVRKGIALAREGVSVLANRHLSIVAAIGAVSAAAVTIVDFQFKASAAAALSQDELAGYFGRFYGVCGGIALGVQIWVTGRVLERFGILASLVPLPAGLAIGSAVSAVVPHPHILVQSFAKGSDTIFRYTINDASMQLLYVPVKPHMRGRAKAFIDGVLKPSAIALTGLVLLLYRQSGGQSWPLTSVVLFLVSLWILLLVRARAEYVRSLVESLERRHLDFSSAPIAAQTALATKALREALRSDPATALHALTLLPQAAGADFAKELLALLDHSDARLRAAALEQLEHAALPTTLSALRTKLEDPVPEVRGAALMAVCAVEQEGGVATVAPFLDKARVPETVVRAAGIVALVRHAGLDGILAAADALKGLLAADDPRDRAVACEALGQIGVRSFYRPLLGFLRDPDAGVRRRAIAAAGKLASPELLPALIDTFEHRDTALEAVAALAAYGPGIEPQLGRALLDDALRPEIRRSVALVLGRLPSRASCDALVPGLHARARSVRRASGRALVRLLRRSRELGFDRIEVEGAIYDELKRARVALAALKKLALPSLQPGQAPHTPAELLGLTLLERRDQHVLQALLLLEVIVTQDVRLDVVSENLKSEQASSRANAIEVVDNALPEPWKSLVLAALDEVKRSKDRVQPDTRPLGDLAASLIAGEAGSWVAACAVRWAQQQPTSVGEALLDEALRGALSSPSAPLREAAVAALAAHLSAADAAPVLRLLENDPARSVRKTVRALLGKSTAERASA